MTLPLDTNDARWQLTLRVLHSPLFEKSPRLSAFLSFICERELTGRRNEINEHQIGVDVFGRPAAYNPGEDSIVRSQARFLRQRLEEYFRTMGQHEPLRITIPKGSYVPLFEENLLPAYETPVPSTSSTDGTPENELPAEAVDQNSQRGKVAAISLAVLLVLCFAAFLLFRYGAKPFQSPESRFWNTVFDPRRTQVIVPADSTLILVEEITDKPVSLQSYLSREYLTNLHLPDCLTTLSKSDLEVSHYTSMADLNLVSRIIRIPEIKQMHAEIRYARDLSISDAKEDNLILIGGPRANPWVELFADRVNFYVNYDWKMRQNSVINKSPRKGEAALYVESTGGASKRVYGLIAFLPSLDNEGNALSVAGTNSAGTQSAADFLLNGPSFSQFLQKIQRTDGSIPHFEILLEALSLGGNVPQSSIVAYRLIP